MSINFLEFNESTLLEVSREQIREALGVYHPSIETNISMSELFKYYLKPFIAIKWNRKVEGLSSEFKGSPAIIIINEEKQIEEDLKRVCITLDGRLMLENDVWDFKETASLVIILPKEPSRQEIGLKVILKSSEYIRLLPYFSRLKISDILELPQEVLAGSIDKSDRVLFTKFYKELLTLNSEIGLVLFLDAKEPHSYPGSGINWYDLSPKKNHFKLPSSGLKFNKNGYFNVGKSQGAFGPSSDSFDINIEHTVILVAKSSCHHNNTIFNFEANSNCANARMLMAHIPWSDGNIYYDVRGCCSPHQRVSYREGNPHTLKHYVFRCRLNQFPNRQVFENGVEKVNSGTSQTSNEMEWGGNSIIWNHGILDSNNSWTGDFHMIKVYNKAINDEEIQESYKYCTNRYFL